MRAYSEMPLEDFAAQLHDIVAAQPFSPRRPLLLDLIESITEGPTEDEISKRISEAEDKAEKAGAKIGREEMRDDILAAFERDGLDPYIGLTETQHEQILELLGRVKP